MAENSKIEWTHHTFNPWRGCTKISPGCTNCYADAMSGRNPAVLGEWGPNGTRVIAAEAQWREPVKWDKWAKIGVCYHCHGKSLKDSTGKCQVCDAKGFIDPYRARVFCASLADVFEGPETMPVEAWPKVRAARVRLFHLINSTPNLDWLLLTKRPQNIRRFCEADDRSWAESTPFNVWFGTSVENQTTADERIPHLLETRAKVRFLSMEPLLGPVNLNRWLWGFNLDVCRDIGALVRTPLGELHWVIVGGESGPQARPIHPEWARSVRDQCSNSGVSFFFKQWGEYAPDSAGGMFSVSDKTSHTIDEIGRLDVRQGGGNLQLLRRVGKKNAGRMLDGREWNQFPQVP